MDDRTRHPLHHTDWRWSLPDEVDDPCDAAHLPTIAEDRIEESRQMSPENDPFTFVGAKIFGKGRVCQVESE